MMAEADEPKKAAAKHAVATVARKELALRVQKATGAKLKDVQLIMRATLTAMSDALKAGEHLRLPPFGAARVTRPADPATGQSMRVALRELSEKEKPAKAAKPAKPSKPARAAASPKAAPAKRAGSKPKRATAAKQALAATDEAD
jgi:nucleoid DNA-binding protein